MLPSAAALAEGLRFLIRRRSATLPDTATLESLLYQAERLAAGREADEPAALFFASACHGRRLGSVAQILIPMLAHSHAATLGLALGADEMELAVLRLRVARRAIDFEELRGWFAERLRPPQP